VPTEPIIPKYAEIIHALQSRIDRRLYRVGALLPSEAELTREFATSRSTVVRALRHLRQHGWVAGVQGKGRIVLGRPASRLLHLPRRVQLLLQADRHSTLLGVRRLAATDRVAAALTCPVGTPLLACRYLLRLAGIPPFGLSTVFALADDVDEPPADGFLLHIERQRDVAAHRVLERLGARPASETEATALALDRRRCLVVSLLTVLDAADRPLLTVETVLSRDVPQLTTSFFLAPPPP